MVKSEKEDYSALILILIATFVLFHNVIHFDFVWDDVFLVPQNPYLSQPINFFEIFSSGFWKFSSNGELVMPYYRPIVTIFYMLEYKIFDLFAGGYHLINLSLHLLNVTLFWKLGFRFSFTRLGRAISTLVFALHPVQVGTVCFISCHGDLLATFFSLLAIHFWFFEKPIRWLSLLWMLFAMLSKEAAVILPVVIFFIDWLVRNRKVYEFEKFLPVTIWVVYFVLRYFALRHNEYTLESSQSIWNTIGSFRTFLFIGRILFPIPVAPESGMPELAIYQKILYHFVYLFLIIVLLIKTRTTPRVRFLIIWFFLTTLLIADWFSFNLRFSDQLLYYPLLPASLLVGALIHSRNKIFYITSLILTVFVIVSGTQVKYWQNNTIFWANAFQKDPENPVYGLSYAGAMQEIGHKKEGCDLMLKTLKIAEKKYHPVYINLLLFNLGNCNLDQDPSVAENYYKKALAVYERDTDSRKNLIIVLMRQDKNQEAVDQARILVQKNPNDKNSWLILGETLKVYGNILESQQAFESANNLEIKK